MDPTTAFDQAIYAIQSEGGQVHWQSPPQSAQFVIRKKDMMNTGGFTVGYNGELTIMPNAPQQSVIRLNLKVDWGSTVPVFVGSIVALIILCLLNPLFLMFGMLLGILVLAYSAWALSIKLPGDIAKKILRNIPGGSVAPAQRAAGFGGLAAFQRKGQAEPPPPAPSGPPPQTVPPAQAGWSGGPSGPHVQAGSPVQPAATDASAVIFDQIKQLAGLRDAGIISAEEFDVKKAELLKRI
ncbi:MAG: SHOCT domain-containing protein [Candidatus Tectomicrobia bacterium]|uniref:SHOCT domain-containing protein n=1 Tax=Tectimicrobiota bacterium TaxID=2528274 RepID=A0A932CN14_UNCTE|nr:SHOCT domain-containing protein [Candidatus Tectomicrobia bacterium]